eukprot:TRINITY_DN31081_c0_g1_i1.p1 TRINITY_DN31081_c0_g1~~TRINITY_DN31081_c0_g1_i1.p1  ORF type:complete len:302 (+),score=36.63 TRINITY_DN31081_c0_g1_i1:36-908(+)
MQDVGIAASTYLFVSVLCYAGSNAARKFVSARVASQADQVFVSSGLEAVCGIIALLCLGGSDQEWDSLTFLAATVAAAVLNSGTRLLELKALSTSKLSEIAPYYGIEPVTQYVTSVVIDGTRKSTILYGVPLAEVGICLVSIGTAYGKSILSTNQRSSFPPGAKYIILNCFICCLTTRLAKIATSAGPSLVLYFTCNQLIMAVTSWFALSPGFWKQSPPRSVVLVAVLEGVYLILFYKALQTIPSAVVTTAKRGGGMVLTSAFGALLFQEKVFFAPILVTAVGVAALCAA